MTVAERVSAKLQPYPAYKDSGVPWIGEVPVGWEVLPIKAGFEIRLGKMLQPAPSADASIEVEYLRAANVQTRGIVVEDVKTMFMSSKEQKRFGIQAGDLVILEGGDIGRSALVSKAHEHFKIQNSLHRVRGCSGHTSFLHYVMQHIKGTGILDVLCNKATIQHLTSDKLANLAMPFPGPSDQQTIAAFLDRETIRIDELVREQEALLEDLAEKRQATISHALEAGRGGDAQQSPVKRAFQTIVGGLWGEEAEGSESDVRCVRVADFDYPRLVVGTRNVTFRSIPQHQLINRLLEPGDLVIEKSGGGENTPVGRAVLWTSSERAVTSNFMARLQPHVGFDGRYLTYLMAHFYSNGVNRAYIKQTTGIQNIDLKGYLEERWSFPCIERQRTTATALDVQLAQIDTLVQEVCASIEDMRLHRSALITAAVTGKIDVRKLG